MVVVAVMAMAKEERGRVREGWGEEREARGEWDGGHYAQTGGNAMEHGERECGDKGRREIE